MCRKYVEERKNLLSQSPLPVAQGLGEEKALISMYTLFKENNFDSIGIKDSKRHGDSTKP